MDPEPSYQKGVSPGIQELARFCRYSVVLQKAAWVSSPVRLRYSTTVPTCSITRASSRVMTPIGAPEFRPGRNGAGLLPGRVKPFGETAFLEKSLLQLPEQLIEQVVGLMDEAKHIGPIPSSGWQE